jgi:nucleotide-binding universal stress UspA family protein
VSEGELNRRPIVVGTDGSDSAGKAVAEAARLAVALGAELHVVYAFEPLTAAHIVGAPTGAVAVYEPLPESEVANVLGSAAVAVKREGLAVVTHSSRTNPSDALIEIADEVDAQMIVVGSRGMHGVRRFVQSSVPNAVSHAARRNVLIVATD